MEIDDIFADLKKQRSKNAFDYFSQRVKEVEQYLNKINPSA